MSRIFVHEDALQPWKKIELILFRFFFLLLTLLTIPFHWSYYQNILSLSADTFSFRDLFQVSHHVPGIAWFGAENSQSFVSWISPLVIAVTGTVIWSLADRHANNYDRLYYWSRAALRYRLAGGMIAYGLLLLLPVLMPAPSLSDLHTAYGDFLPWKVYYHSTAVASAGYRQTIGFFEILGGLLLLNRKTVVFGSIIILFILVNVVLANFAYDIGEHLYSTYLLLVASILLIHDLPRLYTLIVLGVKTRADKLRLRFDKKERLLKLVVRISFGLFTLLFLSTLTATYIRSNWPYPDTTALANSEGYYNVSEFKINNTLLPYSETDPIRWQDVVFEKWNVLSVRVRSPYPALKDGPEIISENDSKPHYESLGNGGRNFYRYEHKNNRLELHSQYDSTDRLLFDLQRPDSNTIVLAGLNKTGDSLSIRLNKIKKDYLLYKGRRKPVSVY